MSRTEQKVRGEAVGIELDCKACYLSFTVQRELAKGELVRCPRCDGYVREQTH